MDEFQKGKGELKFDQSLIDGLLLNARGIDLNIMQNYILITRDKLELCLLKYLKGLESKRSWFAPLGILITIIATFSTTNFRDNYFPASTWKAVFFIAEILVFGWLIKSVIDALKSQSIESFLNEIKKDGIALTVRNTGATEQTKPK